MAYYKKIIYVLPIVLLLLYGYPPIYSQNFEGDYRSHKTSFKDESKSENSFVEETDFDIIIVPKTDEMKGVIIIHDPRIPEQNLIYSVLEYIGELKDGNKKLYLFKAKPEHIDKEEITIVIYLNKNEDINLMITNEESSQTFFNLKKLNKS